MSAVAPAAGLAYAAPPPRYRSLQVLLFLAVLGSLVSSRWLMPSRLERVAAAEERADDALVQRELDSAARVPSDPGETRALVDVALTRGDPDTAAAILQRSLEQQPDSLPAIRLLLEVERQRHRMREVAALDERIFGATGEVEALREAADIYASQHMDAERISSLRRLAGLGRATAADMLELANRLTTGGDGPEALALVQDWLGAQTGPLPSELVAIAAGLSADGPEAEQVARRLGGLIGASGDAGALFVLIQTYAERGRPALSPVAAAALGERMLARPDIVLLLAQLDAENGNYASARARLAPLERGGTLPAGAAPMLANLELQAGNIEAAVRLIRRMAAAEIPDELPRRLVDEARRVGRMGLLDGLALAPIAGVSPASAASMALARGDRAEAAVLARRALAEEGRADDYGPAFGDTLHSLGLERLASQELARAVRAGRIGSDELAFLLDIGASRDADRNALVQALRSRRDADAIAGAAWALIASRGGASADVADWVSANGRRLPSSALLTLLLVGNEHSELPMARAAAAALAGRTDLPDGWTAAEVALAARASETLTAERLRTTLDLLAAQATPAAARDRLAAQLAGSRDFARLAQATRLPADDPALAWLEESLGGAESGGNADARLTLLAGLAPGRALGPLARRWAADPVRLLPIYVSALLRVGQEAEARQVLVAGLRRLPPGQQDAVLQDALARVTPGSALPILTAGAASGRADWVSAYQDWLRRAGRLDELRADLRSRAAEPGTDPARRRAIASQLVELNDRVGAIAVLKTTAAGAQPDSPEVEQLLYLWGPRGDADAVAWTREQAVRAPVAALPKWLDHLAYLGAPQAVLDVTDRRPGVLAASAAAARAYAAALSVTHSQGKPDLRPAIAAASDPDQLAALGQLALDTGQAQSAWRAGKALAGREPNSAAALLIAAQAASSMHRSDDAAVLYSRLLALGPQPPDISVDAGDALLSAKQEWAGRRVLTEALARMPAEPKTLTDARLRARATLLLGDRDGARRLLEAWRVRFPEHAGLKADLLQLELARPRSAF